MNQMANSVINIPTSANAALSSKLKVVCNLSIAALVFCFIIPIVGIVGLAASGKAHIFVAGMLLGFHVFWVPPMMFVTSILGICGYNKGIYRNCPATAHLVFSILSLLIVIGGLVCCGAAIATMKIIINNIIQPFNVNIPFIQPSSEDMILGYSGAGLCAAIYIFLFYYCMHSSIMYCRVPRKTITGGYVTTSTIMPQPLPQDMQPENYDQKQPDGTYNYSV